MKPPPSYGRFIWYLSSDPKKNISAKGLRQTSKKAEGLSTAGLTCSCSVFPLPETNIFAPKKDGFQ